MDTTTLPILHFNDVYRVTPQKLPGLSGPIDVTQFAGALEVVRQSWAKRTDGHPDGLVMFSGDVFSPSVESSVTRGSHMVPVLNHIAPDVSLIGNHEFDFGWPHLQKLVQASTYPWILSNIINADTGTTPDSLHRFQVFERAGVRVGIIGLVEEDWIETVASWPPNFEFRSMEDVGIELSKLLRDPNGEYKCDIVLALSHCRIPNDIELCKRLLAVPAEQDIANKHGVDAVFGGHDHMYYVGKAVREWDGYDVNQKILGTEADDGIYLFKSGNDFRAFSSMELELEDTPAGSVRRKVIKAIRGKRHPITPDLPPLESLKVVLSSLLDDVYQSLKAPVCNTLTEINCKSAHVRMGESASGNYFADVLKHTYDDALCMKGIGGADGVLICGGTLRGDSIYGPGIVSLGDLMEILPFEDPAVVLEIDGAKLYQALENAFSSWPAQEGRFPIVAGFRVEWDSSKPPGSRVNGIWLEKVESSQNPDSDDEGDDHPQPPNKTKGELVAREPGVRNYAVVTRQYMASGRDGYEPLSGNKYLVDEESGMMMSTIVRKFLLGSQYIKHMKQLASMKPSMTRLDSEASAKARKRWKDAAKQILAVSSKHDKGRINSALKVADKEHMSSVDCFDGMRARQGGTQEGEELKSAAATFDKDELVAIAPVIDGRLLDLGRQ